MTTAGPDNHPVLECRVELADDSAQIVPIGEIDIESTCVVHAQLEEVRAAGIALIVLDLRETTFIDSTGMHLAQTWQDCAALERFTFALIRGPRAVQRAFDAAGLGATLNFVNVAP